MKPEEARELFSDAFEGELEPDRKRALEAALAADPALAAEYAEFSATLRALREPSHVTPRRALAAAATPNLLPGVQRKLRVRSRGRFYADRFSERARARLGSPLVIALVMLFVLALAFIGLSSLQGVTPPHP